MFLLNLIQVTWKETSESNKFIGFFEEGHQAKRMFHCKEQKCIILLSATHKLCYFCDGHSHCTFACHLQHPKECHQCFYSTIKTYNFYLFFTHTNTHTHLKISNICISEPIKIQRHFYILKGFSSSAWLFTSSICVYLPF